MNEVGLRIDAVVAGSIAAELGIERGDRLLAINDEPVEDIIDYMFFAGDTELKLTIAGKNGEVCEAELDKNPEEELGLSFASGLGVIRACANHCPFCFVDQMPAGFRRSLYVKDDDWRLSLLNGSYVTLTNFTEHDYERIGRRHVSPLYVSVHATDDTVRRRLLGTARADGILNNLERLSRMGVQIYAQAVILPGINDGEILERTIRDLGALYPGVHSLAVVPVGLTSSRRLLEPLEPFDTSGAAAVLDVVESVQRELLKKYGTRFVFPADEFFLRCGRDWPEPAYYEDFSQIENGVGLAADFLSGAENAISGRARHGSYVLATGFGFLSAAERLAQLLNEKIGLDIEVRGIPNDTFGSSVDVAGLLTGRDVVSALKDDVNGRVVLLPEIMFRDAGCKTLDDMTLKEISRQVGANCIAMPSAGEAFVRRLLETEEE